MQHIPPEIGDRLVIERGQLDTLFDALQEQGYTVVGPAVRDGAIVYDELRSTADLPEGWTDLQDGGTYRLERRADDALFGYAVGPQSWKKYLFPPELRLWRARRGADGFEPIAEEPEARKLAFLGVRSCELHAIAIQDRVFTGGPFVDPMYALQRANAFIIAVSCGHAG